MITNPRQLLLLPLALLLGACGNETAEAPADPAATAPETAAASSESMQSDAQSMAMPRSAAPAGASLYFVGISDGDTVTSPVQVEFGLDGMDVVPAGTNEPQSGHHHIIIDAELPPLDMPIPADANHVHFGDGSTSTTLELEPGEHTLQLLLGDHLHIPHQPPVSSERITITVE